MPSSSQRPVRRAIRAACITLAAFPMVTANAQTAGGSGSGSTSLLDAPLLVDYSLNARTEFVDNLGFSGQSTFVTTVGPGAASRLDSETVKLLGGVSLSSVHFSNSRAGVSRTAEPRFNFNGSLLGDRGTWNLLASYFKDAGFNNTTPQGTAGFQITNAQRSVFSLAPSYSYALTQRLSLNAGYSYSTVWFDRSGPGLVDTVNNSFNSGLQYRFTELDTLGFSVSASKFSTNPDTTASDTRSFQVSWNRRLSEVTTVSANVGLTESDVRGSSNQLVCLDAPILCQLGLVPFQQVTVGSASSSTSPTYGFTFTTQLTPVTTLGLQGNRGVQASGGGTLVDREALSLNLGRRFTDRIEGTVDLSHQKTQFVGGIAAQSAQVTTLSGMVTYSLPDDWGLNAGARFSQADFGTSTPRSSAVYLSVSKSWRDRRVWR